jgi:hypothetical protein
MTSTPARRIALVDRMNAEWRSIGRSPRAIRSLRAVARHDRGLHRLVVGDGNGPPPCATPCLIVEHLRRASGRTERDEAARLFAVLLREAAGDETLGRMLVQLLLPGLLSVARRLQWGRGGEWRDPEEFFGELVATAWLVVVEWAGQDRPYAVLDLLSAVRCRLRRQLMAAKEADRRSEPLDTVSADDRPGRQESDLERLTRLLLELHRGGMGLRETQVLYARHVLGYSKAETAALSGRGRRAVAAAPGAGHGRCA